MESYLNYRAPYLIIFSFSSCSSKNSLYLGVPFTPLVNRATVHSFLTSTLYSLFFYYALQTHSPAPRSSHNHTGTRPRQPRGPTRSFPARPYRKRRLVLGTKWVCYERHMPSRCSPLRRKMVLSFISELHHHSGCCRGRSLL